MSESDRHRQVLLNIFQSALAAANGERRVLDSLRTYDPATPVTLIAMGKAAASMTAGAQAALAGQIRDAFIVTKVGHAETLPWPVHEAGHPLPDENSLLAGERLSAFIDAIPVDAEVLVLLSGGASSLVERLPAGIDLTALRRLNDWLLAAGLDIGQMNRIRRRLSGIKGGRLAKTLAPRPIHCLLISDVAGNELQTIAAGPLVPALDMAGNDPPVPAEVEAMLALAPPWPAADDPCFATVRHTVIADIDTAKAAAAVTARELGYLTHVDTAFLTGDAAEAGERLATTLKQAKPGKVFIWGGEPTVRLSAQAGRGGRCQHLALAAARCLSGSDGCMLLAAGSDGSDGPGEDAGALIDGRTLERARLHGFDADAALARADSGRLFEASGDLLQTGPTGTNVNDLCLGITWTG